MSVFTRPYTYKRCFPDCFEIFNCKNESVNFLQGDSALDFERFLEGVDQETFPKGVFKTAEDCISYYCSFFDLS